MSPGGSAGGGVGGEGDRMLRVYWESQVVA